MGLPNERKNIVRIRTFADDFKRIKTSKNNDSPVSEQSRQSTAVPKEKIVAEKTAQEIPATESDKIVLTEKEDTPEETMVFYDEQDTIIENKPYEEQMAATEDLRKKEEVEEIPIAEELASVAKPIRTSILSDSESSYGDVETQAAGTIIRDTKRKRFQLIPAIIISLTNWFSKQKEEFQESKKDPYTVTKAQHRVETIKAAAKKSMHAPDKDYELVAQRMKKVPRQKEVQQDVSLKPKESIPAPQWSHVTDDTAATIPPKGNSDTQEKAEEVKTIPQTKPQAEQAIPKETTPEPVLPDPAQEQTPPPTKRKLLKRPKKQKTQKDRTPIQFPVRLLFGVIVIATLLGISVSVYFFAPKNTTKDVSILRIPSLVSAQTQIPIAFTQDHTSLFTTILTSISGKTGVVQVYPTIKTDDEEHIASAETIMQTLAPDIPGSFIRAVKEITFGGVEGQPFIVMRTTSFDTAFAGMLKWEDTISADLSPLFGNTVIESFDPHARTDTQVRNAFFKDIVAANHSARLLVDETGQDRIIYAFIHQNTVLITTTKEALEILSPLIR